MQLLSVIASAFFCASAFAAPTPSSYTLITTHSGDENVHLRPVGFTKDGDVAIDATNPMTVFFDGDKLGVTGAHGPHGAQVYIHVNNDNSLILLDDGTDGFSLAKTDIAFDGKQEFGVCVDDSKLYIKEAPASCSQFIGVGIYATEVQN